MASTSQQLEVGINADATGLVRATSQAATALDGLQKDLLQLDAAGDIEFTPELHLEQINKNIALVKRSLQQLDAQRADPNADLDSAQFLAQQRKLFNELKRLDKERIEVEAGIKVDTTSVSRFQGLLGDVTGSEGGGGVLGLASGLSRLGASGAAAGTGVGAAATAVYGLGTAAADVETQIIQLDALTDGMGAGLFADLQQFAKESPFRLDEVTAATKRLVAAGVDLEELPDALSDLGEVAAATGVPLEQIATVFAQMEGKGKVTFEEMQQLAEAGLPVWQTLADEMGLTVEQVQQLATEGKLGADEIDRLRNALGDAFGGTMQAQAASFNGQMSTLGDTISQIGQDIGQFFLPGMTDLAESFNTVASGVESLTTAFDDHSDAILPFFEGFARSFGIVGFFDSYSKSVERAEEETGGFADSLQGMAESIGEVLGVPVPADSFAGIFENMATGMQQAIDAAIRETTFTADVNAELNFLLDRADMLEELRALTEGKDAVQLPADLHIRDIPGLGEKQEQIVRTLSSFVSAGIEQGVEEGRLFAQAKRLVIAAGVDPSEAERVLRQFLGLKREKEIPVTANTAPAEGTVGSFVQRRTGKTIYVTADTSSAEAALARLTATRTMQIIAQIVPGGSSSSSSSSSSERSTERTTGRATAGGTNQRLAPRETPVKVYIDGAEVADRITTSGHRFGTTSSPRRLP